MPLESFICPLVLESVRPVCTPGLARSAVSADALSPGCRGAWPRALSDALVAVQSMPPCFRHTSPVRGEVEPSLQTTMSACEELLELVLPLSAAEGPVWTPGLALSVVSVAGPLYLAPVSDWLRCRVSEP